MHKNQRFVFFYDLTPVAWSRKYPEGLPRPTHYSLARALQDLFEAEQAEAVTSRGALYIQAMQTTRDRCEMLLGFSDKDAADPTLNNRQIRKRRVIKKEDGEGLEHSAHILWKYDDQASSSDAPFLIEGATGIGSTVVVRFINKLLRTHASQRKTFTTDDPEGTREADGSFRKIAVRPGIELKGHPSAELIKDLQKGELSELELYTRARQYEPWDGQSRTVYDHEAVIVKPNPTKIAGKAKALVDVIIGQKASKRFDNARIKFKTDTGVVRAVNVFCSGLKLVEDNGYVRKELIENIGDDLPNAFEEIHAPMMKKMKALL